MNNVAAIGPEQLESLCLRWRHGDLTSLPVQQDFGPDVLEALHTEHLIYMHGDLFYHATKGAAVTNEETDRGNSTDEWVYHG